MDKEDKNQGSQPVEGDKSAEKKISGNVKDMVAPAQELSYYFICSNNHSLIKAYHDIFRVGSPAYGGSAAYYRADKNQLISKQADATAASLLFAGQRTMGSTVDEVATVADVLAKLNVGYGDLFISFVNVGPTGCKWVQEVYATLLSEAVGQGILPFPMYTTANKDAAQFLLDSLSLISR